MIKPKIVKELLIMKMKTIMTMICSMVHIYFSLESNYGSILTDLFVLILFASIHVAILLHDKGLKFVGIFKMATRKFPMKFLSRIELEERGYTSVLVIKKSLGTNECDLLVNAWIDRDK